MARAVADPLCVAVLTFVICVVAVGRPSFWADEAATISASTRPLPDLARLVSSLDAVHAAYYLVMHGWFLVAPPTEGWSRIPSALACAGAAAGLVVLAKMVADRPTALIAGVLFAVLPRTTWAAVEARSFGFACLAAVWVTVVFVMAARRNNTWLWALYSALTILSTVLFIYLVLMLLVHAAVLLAMRADRATLLRFAGAAVAAVAVLTPFVLYTYRQVGQVGWIAELGFPSPNMLSHQYFDGSRLAAVVALLVVLAALCVRPRLSVGALARPAGLPVVIAVAWIVIPTVVLLVFSALRHPVYLDKYLTFTAPGMALLMAVCVRRIGRNTVQFIGLVLVFAVAALPNYVDQRGRYAKLGMDYSDVADLVTAHAAAGDCFLLDDTVTWIPGPIRALVESRPGAFESLVDVGAGMSASEAATMWSQNLPPDAVLDRLARCEVIWTLSQRDPTLPPYEQGVALEPGPRFAQYPAFFRPAQLGFRLVERWQFNQAQVTRAVR